MDALIALAPQGLTVAMLLMLYAMLARSAGETAGEPWSASPTDD